MEFLPNHIYHVFNQGNNGQPIFFSADNYLFFLRKMRKELSPYVDFLCYCLMPNHFHWLVYTKDAACQASPAKKPMADFALIEQDQNPHFQHNLSHAIGVLLSSYTRAINKQEDRRGSLFQQRTKAKNGWIEESITSNSRHAHRLFSLDNDYGVQCFRYIHNNPAKAKLVLSAAEWHFSSAQDYAGIRNGTLCNQQLARELGLV